MSSASNARYSVCLRKAVHVFSAGHFITLTDTLCEPVHGHNWTVAVDVDGPLDAHGMVVDFIALRDMLSDVLRALDHHMLLPTSNRLLQIHRAIGTGGHEEIEIRFENRRWVFPADECTLLPMVNTTAELLAEWIGQQLSQRLAAVGKPLAGGLRVEVDECLGQSGVWMSS
ncbi:MAG: 6-pyruvoyl trahydropterin synthase family protein [Pirellulales bacterium]|jgi:6-pyruvoyltetrahydropterin/6-carboxytetrahydropterin synthase